MRGTLDQIKGGHFTPQTRLIKKSPIEIYLRVSTDAQCVHVIMEEKYIYYIVRGIHFRWFLRIYGPAQMQNPPQQRGTRKRPYIHGRRICI